MVTFPTFSSKYVEVGPAPGSVVVSALTFNAKDRSGKKGHNPAVGSGEGIKTSYGSRSTWVFPPPENYLFITFKPSFRLVTYLREVVICVEHKGR